MTGTITMVYWTQTGRHAFQYVDGFYRVYDEIGDFLEEFKSIKAMDNFIRNREQEGYKEE